MTSDIEHDPMAGLRVLLVEDQPEIAAVTAEILKDAGCEVVWAADGPAALAAARREPFGAVVADVRLPGRVDGAAVAREVARLRPETPILLCSGAAGGGPAEAWLLLPKPYDAEQLIGTLRCLL